jgi:hypothetical protein
VIFMAGGCTDQKRITYPRSKFALRHGAGGEGVGFGENEGGGLVRSIGARLRIDRAVCPATVKSQDVV